MNRTIRIGSAEIRIIDQDAPPSDAAQDAGPEPRLTLEISRGPLPCLESLELEFDSRGLWKVFKQGRLYTFDLAHLAAEVDFSAGRGTLFLKKNFPQGLAAFDYPLDEVLFSKLLADAGSVIVHACGVDMDGMGILLCGASGSGKSTLADLFARKQGAAVLSDDRVAAGIRDGRAWIAGTPWHGTSGRAADRTAALERIFFLSHADKNRTEPLTPSEAAARLASLSVIPYWHGEAAQKALDAVADLAQTAAAADLGFLPDSGAVNFILAAL
jgi:hypothetical protein